MCLHDRILGIVNLQGKLRETYFQFQYKYMNWNVHGVFLKEHLPLSSQQIEARCCQRWIGFSWAWLWDQRRGNKCLRVATVRKLQRLDQWHCGFPLVIEQFHCELWLQRRRTKKKHDTQKITHFREIEVLIRLSLPYDFIRQSIVPNSIWLRLHPHDYIFIKLLNQLWNVRVPSIEMFDYLVAKHRRWWGRH